MSANFMAIAERLVSSIVATICVFSSNQISLYSLNMRLPQTLGDFHLTFE
jgi:hypothetical protein